MRTTPIPALLRLATDPDKLVDIGRAPDALLDDVVGAVSRLDHSLAVVVGVVGDVPVAAGRTRWSLSFTSDRSFSTLDRLGDFASASPAAARKLMRMFLGEQMRPGSVEMVYARAGFELG